MTKIKTSLLAPLFILIILGYFVVANYWSASHFIRIDLTENKSHSISDITKTELRNISDDITIELYISKNLPPQAEIIKLYISDMISEFMAVSNQKISVVWKDPVNDQDAMNEAHTLGIRSQAFQTIVKDKSERTNVYLGIAIRQHDKVEVIESVQNMPSLEYDLLHRILAIQGVKTRVGFLKTDTFPSIDPSWLEESLSQLPKYLTLRKQQLMYDVLRNEFDLSYVDILQNGGIDSSLTTLVVIGTNPLFFSNDAILYELDQFLMRGGNLVLFTPRAYLKQSEDGPPKAVSSNATLFDMLHSYGVTIDSAFVIDRYAGRMIIDEEGENNIFMYPLIVDVQKAGINTTNAMTHSLSQVHLPWINPITIVGDTKTIVIDTLLTSSDTSFVRSLPASIAIQQNWNYLFGKAVQDSAFAPSLLAAHITGEFTSFYADSKLSFAQNAHESTHEGSLVVIPTSSMLSDNLPPATLRDIAQYNIPFLVNIVDALSGGKNLISLRTKVLEDRSFYTPNMYGDTERKTSRYRILNLVVVPILLIIFGGVVYAHRKRIQTQNL